MASDGAAAQNEGSPAQDDYQYQQEMHHQEMNANDINGLQQMDDAEYGDEEGMPAAGGMQISNALAEQRATKKRAQDDVKLLANRIALLKLEEKKVSGVSICKWLKAGSLAANIWASLELNNLVGVLCVQAWKKIEDTKKKAVEIMKVR